MNVVIYHSNCFDGAAAAWVANQKLEEAILIEATYGNDPPEAVHGNDVYIVDFSYPRDVLEQIRVSAASLIVLDHHKTSAEDLDGFPGAVFDMEQSGCGLAWNHFFPDPSSDRPWFISYIEDRDLWRFALPQSKEVNAFIRTHKPTVEGIQSLSKVALSDAAERGGAIQAYIDMFNQRLVEQAYETEIAGHDVLCCNAPYQSASDVAGALAERATFGATFYCRKDGKIAVSLRSQGEFDVSEIAKRFGGGGHQNAAGYVLPTTHLLLDGKPA